MNWYKGLAIGIVAAGGFSPLREGVASWNRHEVRNYVGRELPGIMRSQEEAFGISYQGKPTIVFHPPEGSRSGEAAGWYDSSSDTVYLDSSLRLTSPDGWARYLSSLLTLGASEPVDRVLRHEVGHYYADQEHERREGGNWPRSYWVSPSSAGTKLVSEGIAECFERMGSVEESSLPSVDPDSLLALHESRLGLGSFSTWKEDTLRSLGLKLVSPLLCEGVEVGVAFLTAHPPEEKDFADLPAYQERARQAIRENARKARE